MKNKKALIVSSILIAAGLIVCIIAFAMSGLKTFGYKTRHGSIGISHNNGNYSMGGYISDNENTINNSQTNKLESFNKLNINLNYADLNIKESDNEEFKLQVNYNNNQKIYYSVENSTLNIEDTEHHWFNMFNKKANEIIIFIPRDTNIENLIAYCDMGTTNINNLVANNINLENNMGSVNVLDSNFTNSKISLDMGEFVSSNTIFTNLNLTSNMGSVEINGQILGNNELSVDMGSLDLNLNQLYEETKLIASSDLGSITIDGLTSSGISTEQIINPNGINSIELDSDMGSIDINFK